MHYDIFSISNPAAMFKGFVSRPVNQPYFLTVSIFMGNQIITVAPSITVFSFAQRTFPVHIPDLVRMTA